MNKSIELSKIIIPAILRTIHKNRKYVQFEHRVQFWESKLLKAKNELKKLVEAQQTELEY